MIKIIMSSESLDDSGSLDGVEVTPFQKSIQLHEMLSVYHALSVCESPWMFE